MMLRAATELYRLTPSRGDSGPRHRLEACLGGFAEDAPAADLLAARTLLDQPAAALS